MKKILLSTMAFAVVSAIAFTSCKKTTKTANEIIVGKQWKISSRVENGGTPSLPICAIDDILELKGDATYNSLIGTTQCNPSEVDVIGGSYLFSSDNTIITFTVPGFSYTGKVLSFSESQMTIEFDLGPGFVIKDTFVPKQ
jgi:hypothetical protein